MSAISTAPTEAEITVEPAKDRRFFALLLIIAVIDLWAVPLKSSFWLDETGTFWIIKDGFPSLLTRSFAWVNQSPLYYSIDWLALTLGGRQEWILRLPSFLALVGAIWLFYRLATRLFDAATARLAVLVFVCSEQVVFAASDARPYALGLLTLLGSAWMLLKWLDTGSKRYAAGYVVVTALVMYAHYLFAPALLVLGGYAFVRAKDEGKISIRKLLAAWTACGVLDLPLTAQLLRLLSSRQAHAFAARPDTIDLVETLVPPVLVGSIVTGLFLVWVLFPSKVQGGFTARRQSVLLAAAWALVPLLLLFGISVVTATPVFVPRYVLCYVPGLALIAGWLVRSTVTGSAWRIPMTLLLGTSIFSFGARTHNYEDWAGAMRKIRSAGLDGIPVLAASGFVEADPKALDDPQLREVLFAPQVMYPPSGPLIRLPYRLDPEYVDHVLSALDHRKPFLLLMRYQTLPFEKWISGRLRSDGYRSASLGEFGRLGVYLFTPGGDAKH